VTDDSADGGNFAAMEKRLVDAFEIWHRFHEDLLRLGEFSTWLSDDDNQIDLVTFFVTDSENTEKYRQALGHQREFLDGVRQMIEGAAEMLDEYVARKDK